MHIFICLCALQRTPWRKQFVPSILQSDSINWFQEHLQALSWILASFYCIVDVIKKSLDVWTFQYIIDVLGCTRCMMMYSTMCCDVLPDVLRCVIILFINHESQVPQCIGQYISIQPNSSSFEMDVLHYEYALQTPTRYIFQLGYIPRNLVCSKHYNNWCLIHIKYITLVLYWDFPVTGTFICPLWPVWPPTGVWSVEVQSWWLK